MAASMHTVRVAVPVLRSHPRFCHVHGKLTQGVRLAGRSSYCSSRPVANPPQSHPSPPPAERAKEVFDKFDWITSKAPRFSVCGDRITILKGPAEYFDTLKNQLETCKRRVVFAALYLGTGPQEEELVASLYEACRRNSLANPASPLEVRILLDCTRGSRGRHNSRTMLLPLLRDFQSVVRVSLYHTPDLRGTLKNAIPERYNEVIGLSHLKVCILGDTLIISGANLSESYFTNRQDRYVMLEDCPRLADFFHDLVSAVSSFSFQLSPDDTLTLDPEVNIHPYEGDKKKFKESARDRIERVLDPSRWNQTSGHVTQSKPTNQSQDAIHSRRKSNRRTGRIPGDKISVRENLRGMHEDVTFSLDKRSSADYTRHSQSSTRRFSRDHQNDDPAMSSSSKIIDSELEILSSQNQRRTKSTTPDVDMRRTDAGDTLVFPLVQMGSFGVIVDQEVTCQLLQSAQTDSHCTLASGYFNLTKEYVDLVLGSKASYSILTASPEANGFFGARGISGYVPAAYTFIARNFLRKVRWRNAAQRISMYEYYRQGWTFHVKGLWYYLQGEALPCLTLIGSPNFGHRSVHRDLEAQLAIVTTNHKLRHQLHQERQDFFSQSEIVSPSTFRRKERKVPLWAKIFTIVARNFF